MREQVCQDLINQLLLKWLLFPVSSTGIVVCEYMPLYNEDISQTELYLEDTDVLQSVIDEYAAVSHIYIIGDLNVRLPSEQIMLHRKTGVRRVDTSGIPTSCITLSMTMVGMLLISAVSKMSIIRISVMQQQCSSE